MPPLEQLELLSRLALAALLAGVLGWERQLGQQPAGLRTHMLVSMGAAAYTVAGSVGIAGLGTVQDPGRIAAQIVTGIGFIGAGTIWRSAENQRVIRGLTTAASIWLAAAIGMLCGFGLLVLGAGCAVIGIVVLRLLRGVDRVPAEIWSAVSRSRTATAALLPQLPGLPRLVRLPRRLVPATAAAGYGLPAMSLGGHMDADGGHLAPSLSEYSRREDRPSRGPHGKRLKKRKKRRTKGEDVVAIAE